MKRAAIVHKGRPQTILVVEEQPDVGRLLSQILSGDRTKIVAASSGARALRIAARTQLDLVILDVKLPDLSGTEVLRRLRSIDADVPVLIATSHGSAGTVRAAMELGASDYLTKPFDEDELQRVVHEALASHSMMPARFGVQHAF